MFVPAVLSTLLAAALTAAPAAPAPAAAPATPPVFPRLEWAADERVAGAIKVFTAPADPQAAIVSSAQGLWRTKDGAATWELIPRTAPDVLGIVAHVAFCPARAELLVLASAEKGVFRSEDGGATWAACGGVAGGLAGASVCFVTFTEDDRSWRTLLACHGEAHPGLSRSINLGQSWRVLAPRRFFRHVINIHDVLAGSSAPLDEPDNWAIVFSQNFGENWRVVAANQEGLAACATATRRPWQGRRTPQFFGWREDVLWAVRKGPLLLSRDMEDKYLPAGPAGGGRWAGVFTTPGAEPDQQWLWAYDPFRSGLVGSEANSASGAWQANNHGLPVGNMTLRGANAAANAAGSRFFACVNRSLYVGTPVADESGPTIVRAVASPPVLMLPSPTIDQNYVKLQQSLSGPKPPPLPPPKKPKEIPPLATLTVRVTVAHPRGPSAVTSVRIMPDVLGTAGMPLADDGAHNDGAAGDGVWGITIPIRNVPQYHGVKDDPRRALPGIRPVSIKAVDADGKVASWTMMIGVFYQPRPFMLWEGSYAWGVQSVLSEGKATIAVVKDAAGPGRHVQVKGAKGPWTACWANPSGTHDLTGLEFACFELTASPGAGEVAFCLVDGLDRPNAPVEGPIEPNFASRFVPLLAGKYVPAMDGKTYIVRVPVAELVRDVRFMRTCLAGFGLRAEEPSAGGTYDIGRVWLENRQQADPQ